MAVRLNPTLGPQVAHFIQTFGCHGPGDLIGEAFECTPEELAFLYSAYEYVDDPYRPGRLRRRYRHCVYSRRKGTRKTEIMSLIAFAEFDGPVRWSGEWAKGGEVTEWGYVLSPGEPVGVRVTSPEIPFVATTEEQAELLAWGVFSYILKSSPLAERYKVLADEVFFEGRPKESGRAFLIPPTNPEAADGAKPTFVPREEGHLWISRPLRKTAATMDRNTAKRQTADPWTMDASTMYAPGEGSVLEAVHKTSKAGDSSVLFDLRQASESWNLDNDDQWLSALRESSGDAWDWTPINLIRSEFLDPEKSRAEFCRYWLNQAKSIESKPFSGDIFDRFADPSRTPNPAGSDVNVVVFLDGSLTRDATVLIGWTIEDRPHLFLVDAWERPTADLREAWKVPKAEVVERVDENMDGGRWGVSILGGDSDRYWSPQLVEWESEYGSERVVHFPTRHGRLMDKAIDLFLEHWAEGVARLAAGEATPWTHDGSPLLRRHFASTVVTKRAGSSLRILAKESEGIDDKIDGCVAAVAGYAMVPAARVKVDELSPVASGIW